MTMNFEFADDLGLAFELIALRPASQPFTTHLYQHQGAFIGNAHRIGNGNNVLNKFRYFFDQAKLKGSDLVLTPEYSCPWEIIMEIVNDENLWPIAGKLWVIGCESITKQELAANRAASNKQNIFFHSEPDNPGNNKSYYDPLVYLFKAIHYNVEKLVVLVQFKTRHMGVWFSAIERDHLIEGTTIWILKNQEESQRFMSIICSEAMNFSKELTAQKMIDIGWNTFAYFIYHPQANPDPTHPDFIDFRKFVLNTDRKEIIALNWGADTSIGNDPFIRIGTTRSGFYTQSDEVDLAEPRVRLNHRNGLYYYQFGKTNHAFMLNRSADIFQINTSPIIILKAANPQARRDGPLVMEVEKYEPPNNAFSSVKNSVIDAHITLLTGLQCGCQFLMQPASCIFEKERLVCLSCGQLKKGYSLTDFEGIPTLLMKQDVEPNLRITVDDDVRHESLGVKSSFINSLNILIHDILPKKQLYPDSIADLINKQIYIGFGPNSRSERFRYNVVSPTGASCKATMVYMDGAPDNEIKASFDIIQEMFDLESTQKRRVVIFYRRGANYHSLSDPNAGNILHTEEKDGANILNV